MPTFAEMYDSLPERYDGPTPRKRLRLRVCAACKCSEATVLSWVKGRRRPDGLALEALSRELGVPEQELFPEKGKEG